MSAASQETATKIVTYVVAALAVFIIIYVVVEALQPQYHGKAATGTGASSYSDNFGSEGMMSTSIDTSANGSVMSKSY